MHHTNLGSGVGRCGRPQDRNERLMRGYKIRCEDGQALLQLIQRPLTIVQPPLKERQQGRGIRLMSTTERLAHARQGLRNRKQVFGAIKPSLFEVIKQPLNRTCKRISVG